MCDYSLRAVACRDAEIGETVVWISAPYPQGAPLLPN